MKHIVLFVTLFTILTGASAQEKRIYLAPDDHTDYMWSADEPTYRKAFLETLDYYIRLNDSTSAEPYSSQSKWNCDGSYWVYEYEKNRTSAQFSNLLRQIRDGKITIPMNTLPGLMGIAPLEAEIRDMYYAGSLERKYDLKLDLVINMEDQVLPLGLSSVWAGSGAKYSWRGVCDCATKVTGLSSRPHEIYWYKGLDDRKILMKWYSLAGDNKQLGGYAEARDPEKAIRMCLDLMNSKKYPYEIAGAFGKGWDDLKTATAQFVQVAKHYRDSSYRVIVSNEVDFFRDFEEKYGSVLPSECVSYGSTEWGNSLASLAEVSAQVKRSVEKMRAAEALYTLVALKDIRFGKELGDMREKAWISLALYFDHDWTADGTVISKKQRAEWARETERSFSRYVDTLYNLSLNRLGEMIKKPGNDDKAFFVFNPLGWKRTDYCDFGYQGPEDIMVIDAGNQQDVPFQFITRNGKKLIRIVARDIPSIGYKVFLIRKYTGQKEFGQPVSVSDSIIENKWYRIIFSTDGAVKSLIYKVNNYEYIKPDNQLYANDLGHKNSSSGSPVKVENRGPVTATLVAESDDPVRHTSRITLSGFNDRIEFENIIRQNIGPEPLTYSFSFNLTDPEIWHEEAGAILKAGQQSEGGHYADSICRLDWIAMNHFAEMSGTNGGIILSNRDAYFMKPGKSTIKKLDTKTPQINVLAAGQVDAPGLGIINQDGDSYFENHFALKPVTGGVNVPEAMRFSLEHQNPLIAGNIAGTASKYGNSFSLFNFTDPNVLAWAVKPAEEGIGNGIVLRIWNLSDQDEKLTISAATGIAKCISTTHVEKNVAPIGIENGVVDLKVGHNRIETLRIFLK